MLVSCSRIYLGMHSVLVSYLVLSRCLMAVCLVEITDVTKRL